MGDTVNKISSGLRSVLNGIRRNLVKNPIARKRLSIIYHNAFALADLKKQYDQELFDYKKILSGKRHFLSRDFYFGNSLYGQSKVFSDYANYHGTINACIEHGVYLGDYYSRDEAIDSGLNGLLTFGDSRLEHLKHVATVPVIAIGPYIHYAEPLLNEEEISKIKRENGNTLLVFPSHSIDRVEKEFDYESFNREIQRMVGEKDVRHVMVCLFYKDVDIGRDQYYLDQGYQVVCSGSRCDPMFLRRLKTFILLSDYTMSNDVGTSVGYSVYLGKPHYLFQQDFGYNPYSSKDMENVIVGNVRQQEANEIKRAFSTMADGVTPEQNEVCERFWGIKHVKSRDELYEILQSLERHSQNA